MSVLRLSKVLEIFAWMHCIAICDGQAPEDGDLPQKCAERFLKKPSELEIQAEE